MPTAPSPRPWVLVTTLGIAQIISWGSIYYAIALLIEPLSQALHASASAVVGAYSAGLLATGLASTPVGALIDRYGGRWVMTGGSLLGGVLLALLPFVQTLPQLYAVWIGLGIAMGATLYDPAFAVLTQVFRERQRRAITALTLFGGFASTVFWPLTQWLVAHWGWAQALFVLAAFNLFVNAPLHAAFIPRGHGDVSHVGHPARAGLGGVLRDSRFWAIAVAFTANSLVFSAMALHLIGLLHRKGLTLEEAAWIGAIVGPMQVLGRVLEHAFLGHWPAARVGVIAIWMLPAALALFLLPGAHMPAIVGFALLYGISNGVLTIVRGALPRELFGSHAYGAVNGALATPTLMARAAGPIVAAFVFTAFGDTGMLLVLGAVAVVSALVFAFAVGRSGGAAGPGGRE